MLPLPLVELTVEFNNTAVKNLTKEKNYGFYI